MFPLPYFLDLALKIYIKGGQIGVTAGHLSCVCRPTVTLYRSKIMTVETLNISYWNASLRDTKEEL